jgi:hypothetical protein
MFGAVGLIVVGCGAGVVSENQVAKDVAATMMGPAHRPYDPLTEVDVVGNGRNLPQGCSPKQIVGLVEHFFDAFNRGDTKRLGGLFGSEFQWYSVTEEGVGHTLVLNRDDLFAYLAGRHAEQERLALLSIGVGHGRLPKTAGIAFVLDRSANDLSERGIQSQIAGGKGSINCHTQTIYVWSMGMPKQEQKEDVPWPCPTAAQRANEKLVIACTY